jgi:hypothetical protein
MTRLLDAYQASTIELPELQKRRRLVDAKLDTLNRENLAFCPVDSAPSYI